MYVDVSTLFVAPLANSYIRSSTEILISADITDTITWGHEMSPIKLSHSILCNIFPSYQNRYDKLRAKSFIM